MAIRIPPKTDQDAKDSTAALTAAAGTAGPATPTTNGTVKQGVAVADAAAGTEVATINALLASLRTAGVIAT